MRPLALIVAVALGTGCAAPQPILAPSPRLQQAGSAQAQQEIRECMRIADRAAPLGGAERAAQESAAIPGRTAGTTRLPGGGIVEGPPRATAPDPTVSPAWRTAVERCLTERGYRVDRWE